MDPVDDQIINAKGRFTIRDLENQMFIDNVLKCSGTEALAKTIYDAMKKDSDIPEALKEVYRIGLYTKNRKAKNRVRNRMYTLRRNNK